jgi:Pyridoxal-dependent decarboxylase conserved domain
VEDVLAEFAHAVLPLCKNEASPRFLGFGDTGDDIAALAGDVLALFTQQNLINQSFDSPSATFIEITVLRWLRELIGTNSAFPMTPECCGEERSCIRCASWLPTHASSSGTCSASWTMWYPWATNTRMACDDRDHRVQGGVPVRWDL